jgi:glycosyltransferase involved in cell wall biosynthesis
MAISLALPVYNGANYIGKALESAVAQGAELAEIVVSDNCSTDDTPAIIAEFARRDLRVRHERSEVFLNQADNVSRAVRLCRNEWVQMLCHDDLLRPGAIAMLAGVIAGLADRDCALISHQPCHLFVDGHTHRHVAGRGRVETLESLMGSDVKSESEAAECHPADNLLASALRRGGMPYLPSVTTAAVRRSVFESLGGFDPRWVHFDVFLWTRLIRDYGYAISASHWTLTRVHAAQVAVQSRRNQRSYRDFRDFYGEFVPAAHARYALSPWACYKLRLKPLSQASAPLVVALRKRAWRDFFSQWFALPWWLWLQVLALTGLNYFREGRRNAELWKSVPPALTYE